MKKDQLVVSLLVANHPGALIRVSSLFSRRGINISSLNVVQTENPEIARISLVADGGAEERGQIANQLEKIYDVKKVSFIRTGNEIAKKRLIVQAAAGQPAGAEPEELPALREGSLLVEIIGDEKKMNAFVDYVKPYGIIELNSGGTLM